VKIATSSSRRLASALAHCARARSPQVECPELVFDLIAQFDVEGLYQAA